MKLSERIKNKKKFIIGIVIGIVVVNIIGIAGAIAASVTSDVVLYDSPTGKKNVKDAIDELYTMSSTHCINGFICTAICNTSKCIDNDNDGIVSFGDIITLDTNQELYVIGFSDGNIRLYTKTCLTSSYETGGTCAYKSLAQAKSATATYKNTLTNLGIEVVDVSLMSADEFTSIYNVNSSILCSSPSWILETNKINCSASSGTGLEDYSAFINYGVQFRMLVIIKPTSLSRIL